MGEVVAFRRRQRGAVTTGFLAGLWAALVGLSAIGLGLACVLGGLILIWFGFQSLP